MKKTLVAYVPGIGMKTSAWNPLIKRLQNELNDVTDLGEIEWAGWNHGCQPLSAIPLMTVSQRFCDWLDSKWFTSGGYEKIILIGHSIGGIIARQAYLLSTGIEPGRPASDWWKAVDRFILLAAVNRGIKPNRPWLKIYDLLLELLSAVSLGKKMTGQDGMFGSEFITNLRLQWIKFMASLPDEAVPTVVQILGRDDSVVTRDDSIDLEQFPHAFHIPVPEVGHGILPLIERGKNGELRFQIFRDSILGLNLSKRSEETKKLLRKRNVVFILHGIRASNRGWVSQLAELIEQTLPDTEVIQSSYGYLSALEFLLPWLHRRPLRWFHNKYADYFAANPNANFYFIGHSNGTYILGHSLLELTGMQFQRIILAGSVLPTNYPWREIYKRGQYKELRNDQANLDFPVGFLCGGLNGLGRKDIGKGGYEGFEDDDNSIFQYAFHEGDHGAALHRNNLVSFLDFIINGKDASKPANLAEEKEKFSLLTRVAPWIFRVIVLVLIGLFAVSIITQSVLLFCVLVGALVFIGIIFKVL
ncbi:lipase family alpha/beta hydrolase [Leptolyngbya sp. KIOST-1]|uniref:lipase family alpha/beta hydrolase n=1 Tax=Leptolyngbya sp. KIOST-1 TaxID=1229172 RepID=UPI000564EB6D|nr:hypothetical protein [Leptolyngbya sp. KIOST-1]